MENSESQNADLIVFDASSGFSIEEQQEILDKINSLSVEKGIVAQEGLFQSEAKKKGFLFPLLVNFAALLLVAGGFVLLWSFHSQEDQGIREGASTLDVAERMLIQEIRQETSRQLNEKETEINDVHSQLAAIGLEYRALQLSLETLSDEQMARAEYLRMLQEDYQNMLAQLQNERAKILEDSRLQEAVLRAQAEERAREFSSFRSSSLDASMEELAMLTGEQERIAAAEAQLRGYYAVVNERILAGEFTEAADALKGMKDFLHSPLFQTSRSMEARKQLQLAAVASLEDAIALYLRDAMGIDWGFPVESGPENDALTQFQARIEELEQANRDQERIIGVLNSQDSSRAQIIAEYDNRVSNLQSQNTMLQARNSTLDNQNYAQQVQIAGLQTQNSNLQGQISSQLIGLSQRDNTIQDLRGQNAVQEQRLSQSNARADELQRRASDLSQTNEELNRRMNSLPQSVEQAIEDPAIQNLLGPGARQAILQIVQEAIQQTTQE